MTNHPIPPPPIAASEWRAVGLPCPQIPDLAALGLDPYRRTHRVRVEAVFPTRRDGRCACGCGRMAKRRWATVACGQGAFVVASFLGGHSDYLRVVVAERAGFTDADGVRRVRCAGCGAACAANDHPQAWHADHVVAVADGGGIVTPSRVQALCTPCHVAKTRGDEAARRGALRAPAWFDAEVVAIRAEARRLAVEVRALSMRAGLAFGRLGNEPRADDPTRRHDGLAVPVDGHDAAADDADDADDATTWVTGGGGQRREPSAAYRRAQRRHMAVGDAVAALERAATASAT